jgi:hypothetical protein
MQPQAANQHLANSIASVWGPKLSLHHPNIDTNLLGLSAYAFAV